MLLRLYSLVILLLDLVTLLIGIWFSVVVAIYRTLRPPALKNIHGEVAMVVGAGRGVGREIAIQLSQLGVKVACVDVNAENCGATVNKATHFFGSAKLYLCDVTNEKQVIETVNSVRSELGEVTMLFHCCGVPSPRSLTEDPIEIRKIFDISILSHFLLLDAVLPDMRKIKKGHIIVLSSVAGLSGGTCGKSCVPLSTAQFAVQGFAESLRSDIQFRIPSYFGTMPANEAAKKILDGVRRNYAEFSVPGYLLYVGHILRVLPKKASFLLRDLLDTGVDFA
ncbi:hypothetical protein QAD02_020254 [Eretmocerus hayati]|uniref:Uncharacterized protein n=1 Tax=Eretmocerus hayati TaxID=131215 RepID=A0ACC2PQ36_9HYME|nr:hypothetical protein QAD02_020254 [Eretmocerus hayati]